MPKRQIRPRKPRRPPSKRHPNQYGGNGFRIAFARRRFAAGDNYSEVRNAMVEHFGIHRATAEKDIAEAKRRNDELTNKQIPELIARSSQRLDMIADLAVESGKYTDAVQAMREFHRIHGMHAAKKIQVSGQVVNVALDIHMVVGVLDEAGLAALEVVLGQIEAAKSRGELQIAAPADETEDDEDATGEHAPVTEN